MSRHPSKSTDNLATSRSNPEVSSKHNKLLTFIHLTAKRIQNTSPLTLVLLLVLFVATCYSSFYAGYSTTTNSDAIVYPYIFEDGFADGQALVPDKHANILKYPLFYLQQIFPYHLKELLAVNMLLVLGTIFGWAALLMRIFNKKYHPLILSLLCLLVLSSREFNTQLAYTTIRNIEYPIALAFLMSAFKIAYGTLESIRTKAFIGISFLLYALLLSGDNYFQYTVSFTILVVLAAQFAWSKLRSKRLLAAIGFTILASVSGLLLKLATYAIGIAKPDKGYLSELGRTPLHDIWVTAGFAKNQLLHLSGMATWGNAFSYQHIYMIGSAALFSLAIIASIALGLYALKKHQSNDIERRLVIATLGMTAVISFAVYVASGLVIRIDDNGVISDLSGSRYIAIIPLLFVVAITALVARLKLPIQRIVIVVLILSILAIPLASVQNNKIKASTIAQRDSFINIASILKKNHVDHIVTGYWYGAALRFWSRDTIHFAVVADCNLPSPINSRRDWYKPSSDVNKTALVIDMSGPDLPFLGYCPGDSFYKIYGAPTYTLPGASVTRDKSGNMIPNKDTPMNLWFYDYDIRSKLRPIPQ